MSPHYYSKNALLDDFQKKQGVFWKILSPFVSPPFYAKNAGEQKYAKNSGKTAIFFQIFKGR